jgi:endonuclease-3
MAAASQKSSSRGSGKRARRPPGGLFKQPELVYHRLSREHPDAECALTHRNAFELLVATILSAQCTDERVNQVTPGVFERWPTPEAMAEADPTELEEAVRSTGFYRNKAKALREASRGMVERFGGEVPGTMEDLRSLRGVARKTANVVLGNAFDAPAGVVVDTHVARLGRRLGLSAHTDPDKIERDLMELFDSSRWTMLAHLLIFHGRRVCQARRPRCESCCLGDVCPKVGV